jgi:lysophospholipase
MPSLSAPDGTLLVYDAYEPSEPRAVLLFLHDWADHAARWAGFGERLRDAGLAAYLLDLRGHGRSGGRRGHLTRFSQLLGDLKAFRRAVRLRVSRPQVLVGHSFGGLVALRYLETQPDEPLAASALSNPWLGLAFRPPWGKRLFGRLLGNLWPTLAGPVGIDTHHLSRDPAVNAAWQADPAARDVMTVGAWLEIQWAQRAVVADAHRIETPVLFLLGGEDRITDAHLARAFAGDLKVATELHWYAEMHHELLHDPQSDQVVGDLLAFVAQRLSADTTGASRP